MADTIKIYGKTFSDVEGIKVTDSNDNELTFVRPTGTLPITQNGTVDVSEYASASVNVSGGGDLTAFVNGTLSSFYDTTVTSLRSNLFRNFTRLVSVNVPNCNRVESEAFYGCTNLPSSGLTFGSDLVIDDNAFRQCRLITEIPQGTKTIGAYAFVETGISGSLVIPNTVTSIG